MKLKLLLLFVVCAAVAQVQPNIWLPIWQQGKPGNQNKWIRASADFTLDANGQFALAQHPAPRQYGVRLQPDATGKLTLPAGATNVVIYLNGLRQASPDDYTLSGSTVVLSWPWPSGSIILADFD